MKIHVVVGTKSPVTIYMLKIKSSKKINLNIHGSHKI